MEVALGQICACLPFTNLLLKRRADEGKRNTKMSQPTTSVAYGSRPGHRLKSFDSTPAHFGQQRMPSSGYDESRLSPKKCSLNIEPSTRAWEASSSHPVHSPNRTPSTKGTAYHATLPRRVITSRRIMTFEELEEAARCPASQPAVDDWYWHDLEGNWGLPGDAEPLSPPRPCAANILQAPSETVLPNRIAR